MLAYFPLIFYPANTHYHVYATLKTRSYHHRSLGARSVGLCPEARECTFKTLMIQRYCTVTAIGLNLFPFIAYATVTAYATFVMLPGASHTQYMEEHTLP